MGRNGNRFNGFPQPGQVAMPVPLIGRQEQPQKISLRDRLGLFLSEAFPKSVKGLYIDYHATKPAFVVTITDAEDRATAHRAEFLVPTVLVARGGDHLWDLLATEIDKACETLAESTPKLEI